MPRFPALTDLLHLQATRLFLVLCSLLLLLTFAWYTASRGSLVTHGFVVYYTNGRMLVEGEEFRRAYDYGYFNRKMEEYGIEGIKDVPHNLPTNALLLAPLAWTTPAQAKIVLSVVSFAAILSSLAILLNLYGVRIGSNLGLSLCILCLVWRPIYDNIYLGQIYSLLLLLFCLGMLWVRKAGSSSAAFPLALTLLLKGNGVVPLMWLVVQRSWRVLLVACAVILAVVLGTLPLFGVAAWSDYFSKIVSKLGTNPTDAGASYQTINSLVYHLFTYDAQWLPNPAVELPGPLVRLISYALNLLLILHVLLSGRNLPRSARAISFSAAVAAGVVTAPLAEEYAFTLFLPLAVGLLVAVAANFKRTHSLGTLEWICLSAIFILALPIQYKTLHYASFPLVLLTYPKLFAGIAALLCFSRMAKSGYLLQEADQDAKQVQPERVPIDR